jgi:hypothetical protein
MAISFVIGYALFFLLGLIQIPVLRCFLKRRYESFNGTVSNLFHLIAFVSVVQIWRSLWMLCEQYIEIPGYHLLTLWLCYVGAYVVLTCGLAACSLNGPGGAKDGYDENQPMLLFKFEYMSTLLKVNEGMNMDLNIHVSFLEPSGSIEGTKGPPASFGFVVDRNDRRQRTPLPISASLVSFVGRFVIYSRIGNYIGFALPKSSIGFSSVGAPHNSIESREHSSQWNLRFLSSLLFSFFF